MSPIETATAFGAPVMRHGRVGASKDILKVVGDSWVICGKEVNERRVDMRTAQTQTVV